MKLAIVLSLWRLLPSFVQVMILIFPWLEQWIEFLALAENSHRRGTSPTPSPDVYCRSTSPLSRNVSPTISTRKHLQQQRSFSPGSYLKPPSPVHPRSGTPDETRRDYGPVTVEPRPMTAPNSPDMKPKLQGYSRGLFILAILNDIISHV